MHAHIEIRFLLLSFNREQRARGVINQLASETQLERGRERERGRSGFIYTEWCGIRVLVWLTFPSASTSIYLSVLWIIFIKLLVTVCSLAWDKRIPAGRVRTPVGLAAAGLLDWVRVWCSYLREAAHVDHNELRWFHGDLTQLVQRKLSILSRHHDVIKSS